jgi:hypothetical protein
MTLGWCLRAALRRADIPGKASTNPLRFIASRMRSRTSLRLPQRIVRHNDDACGWLSNELNFELRGWIPFSLESHTLSLSISNCLID